jgi:6-pyruvoyltetrahydropterin/6-carboxytetrahydropterin synthase
MVIDLGIIRQKLADVRVRLDHHLLDEVEGVGIPTLENIAAFIAMSMKDLTPSICAVKVWRDGIADACLLELS